MRRISARREDEPASQERAGGTPCLRRLLSEHALPVGELFAKLVKHTREIITATLEIAHRRGQLHPERGLPALPLLEGGEQRSEFPASRDRGREAAHLSFKPMPSKERRA